ncbi:MAG: HEAT repeat domain-containing protein [Myxococcales bacterium]|nr:HEAT repeat domain-containing protein [Myxococcales bacterium]
MPLPSMDSTRPVLGAALLAVLACGGCATGARGAVMDAAAARDWSGAVASYDRARETDGPDPALLERVALSLLVDTALYGPDDEARHAVDALARAGRFGRIALGELRDRSRRPEILAPVLRALLGGAGGAEQPPSPADRDRLHGFLASKDPRVVEVAMVALRPATDRVLARSYFRHGDPRVRRAAVAWFAKIPKDPTTVSAIAFLLENDSEILVRVEAARALGRFGEFSLVRPVLDADDPSLRRAAALALCDANRERAVFVLRRLWTAVPSDLSVAAASCLATDKEPSAASEARRHLLDAVSGAPNPSVRSAAAIALGGPALPPDEVAVIQGRLAEETDRTVRLHLAEILRRSPVTHDVALGVLATLARTPDMAGTQAAATLVDEGFAGAEGALLGALVVDDPAIRRVAGRALGRVSPDLARGGLADPDAGVRLATAEGILRRRAVNR